jgi:hypothetical protein
MRRGKELILAENPGILMICFSISCSTVSLRAQEKIVWNLVSLPEQKRVQVFAGGQKFTEFIYPDSLEKPVLYPIYSSDGEIVTRGFPLVPREGEHTDHHQHLGLWLNYENVNGLDFEQFFLSMIRNILMDG